MQTKSKRHVVNLSTVSLVYEQDKLVLWDFSKSQLLAELTPETVRQMKMVMDLYLIDQYQV